MQGQNFTEDVRLALDAAREEATKLRHEYVGTEHILLGLIRQESSFAVQVLQKLSIDPARTRAAVLNVLQQGKRSTPGSTSSLPYTSRAKKSLELAMYEARERGHSFVGGEHLLVGLMREEGGPAAQILRSMGATLEKVRAEMQWRPSVADAPSVSANVAGGPRVSHPVVETTSWLRRAYAVFSGGIILLGVVHTLATFRFFAELTQSALWFASAGLLMILTGALNYLNLAYGRNARGIRRTSVLANLTVTMVAAVAGIVGRASLGEQIAVVGLAAGMTALSIGFAYYSTTRQSL